MAKEKKPSYSDYIVMHFATVALEKSEPPFPFVYLKERRPYTLQSGTAAHRRMPPCQFLSFTIAMSYTS